MAPILGEERNMKNKQITMLARQLLFFIHKFEQQNNRTAEGTTATQLQDFISPVASDNAEWRIIN